MHVLLPPSETKRSGGGGIFAATSLSGNEVLGAVRSRVQVALEALCEDEAAAAKALKLGVKSRAEILHNLTLNSSGVLPAIERYTGVIFDTLEVHSLDTRARTWVNNHVSIQSALFGLLQADDQIPAYRLSAATRLPKLHSSLQQTWVAAHKQIDWAEYGWVLDMRSKGYAALAPVTSGSGNFLNVAQRGDDGHVRALNHFNKAAKGDLVRRLALSSARIDSQDDFLNWGRTEGLEILSDGAHGELTLVAELVS